MRKIDEKIYSQEYITMAGKKWHVCSLRGAKRRLNTCTIPYHGFIIYPHYKSIVIIHGRIMPMWSKYKRDIELSYKAFSNNSIVLWRFAGSSREAQRFLSRHSDSGAQVIVRMRGLPYSSKADHVVSIPPCKIRHIPAFLSRGSLVRQTVNSLCNYNRESIQSIIIWICLYLKVDHPLSYEYFASCLSAILI